VVERLAAMGPLSVIEELVFGELAKQKELTAFERGFHWQRGDDATRLWFQPTTVVADDFGLSATAFIETVFSERLGSIEVFVVMFRHAVRNAGKSPNA
jgi:hypothetical protein